MQNLKARKCSNSSSDTNRCASHTRSYPKAIVAEHRLQTLHGTCAGSLSLAGGQIPAPGAAFHGLGHAKNANFIQASRYTT